MNPADEKYLVAIITYTSAYETYQKAVDRYCARRSTDKELLAARHAFEADKSIMDAAEKEYIEAVNSDTEFVAAITEGLKEDLG